MGEVQMLGNPTRSYRDLTMQYNYNGQIVAHDGLGREQWRFSLQKAGDRLMGGRYGYGQGQPPHFARSLALADGEVMLFSVGTKLVAFDARHADDYNNSPQLLWIRDMADENADFPDRNLPHVEVALPWEFQNGVGPTEDRLHVFGPVRGHYVCFHRLGDLVAADPRDGKTLWVRRDLPQDCVVFGDDRYVFVLAGHRDEAMVLQASNGELLGMRKVPPIADERAGASCLATLGRRSCYGSRSRAGKCLAYSTRWRAGLTGRSANFHRRRSAS